MFFRSEVIPLRDGPVIEIVRVAEPAVHLSVAAAINGPGFAALQLVYADDRGHWPWDVGFRGGRGGQPVLGARDVSGAGAEVRVRADGGRRSGKRQGN